jgi:AAA15 family ATPase/GTPase
MLDSLEIKNYRSLKNLKINKLGAVNLFTGKNNTGKSTILEAVALYASKGDLNLISQLLTERGESFQTEGKDPVETNVKVLSSMFTNRIAGFSQNDYLSIGAIGNTSSSDHTSAEQFLSLKFVKYFYEIIRDDSDATEETSRRVIIDNDENKDNPFLEFYVGLEIKSGQSSYILSLHRVRPLRFITSRNLKVPGNYQYIRTRNIEREINGKLWDNITLSEKETFVIEALKLIEPNIERIAFVEEGKERNAVAKLSNSSTVIPLKSMGDGINRIMTIILALVNADNGFLLIDEFENGLHYSIQEKLWEIIFEISQKMKIQVFATTHSEDCIAGFEKALNSTNNDLLGQLIRLDLKDGIVKQVEFNKDELKIANDQNIETR